MLRSQTGEKQLSAAFAFLLDPTKPHGQGQAFLWKFLELILPSRAPKLVGKCEVIAEYYIPQNGRYVDMLLRFPESQFAIGIENKPWFIDSLGRTFDLERQVQDYCDHLHARYADNWFFVYLSGGGLNPPSNSIADSEWAKLEKSGFTVRMSYATIADAGSENGAGLASVERWLENCVEVCEADNVTRFLRDLLGYVRRMVNAEKQVMTIPQQQIVDFVIADGGRLNIAQEVKEAMDEVPKILISALLANVAAAIRQELGDQWTVEAAAANYPDLMAKNNELLTVRHNGWPSEVYLGISSVYTNCAEIYAGVWSDPAKNALMDEIWADLQKRLAPLGLIGRPRTPSEWWPVWVWLEDCGFSGNFSEPGFLELARQISRKEAPADNEAARFGNWLAGLAREADRALRVLCEAS